MPKFNTPAARPQAASPVVTEARPSGTTFEGGAGYARDARSELFLLAVTNMVGETTFYEDAGSRDARFEQLVRGVAVSDPEWLGGFVPWLRGEAHMRSASLVAAAEAVHARLTSRAVKDVQPGSAGAVRPAFNRRVIADACQRPDEPGELLAYWTSQHGRAIPKPVKRGIADAAARLYTGKSLLKYDTPSHGYRFGDVIELTHPAPHPDKPWQGDLFAHALDRRHHPDEAAPPESLWALTAHRALMMLPVSERRAMLRSHDAAERLARAGFTWEMLAGWLQGPMDADAWSAIIPSMGYMSLLRNLRNFDEARVPDLVVASVIAKLADPAEVARCRQLPFRFLSAYRAAPSLRWSYPLEQALGHSLGNIPSLRGRTLILVDTSSSMDSGFSRDGTLRRWDAAALFGIALGHRCEHADVVSFSSSARYINEPDGANVKRFPLAAGESVLRSLERWKTGGWFLGGGTATAAAVRAAFTGHDRIVIVTDEQAAHDGQQVSASAPAHVPMYTWNLAGYARGHAPSGGNNRHTFGGLTDQAFRMIPLLESGRTCAWPWLTAESAA